MQNTADLKTPPQPAGFAARFRLTKAQGVVQLHGPLNQASNFALLSDLYGDTNVFDLSGITSVSWAGVVAFEKYLVSAGKPVQIVGITNQVYAYLRLLLIDQDSIEIAEADISTFDPHAPRGPAQIVRVRINDLERLAVEQGPVITLANGRQVLGIAEHICPRYFQRPRAPAPVFANAWCLANNDEAAFWYNFVHLASCTLGLGLDLIETARQGLGPSSSEMTHRLRAFELGAILVDVEAPRGLAAALTQELHTLDAKIASLHVAAAAVITEAAVALRQTQVACWSQSAVNPAALREPLVALCALAAAFTGGVTAAAAVKACQERFAPLMRSARELSAALVALDPLNWSAEALPQLRDLFALMNPLSQDDWPATLDDLQAEKALVDESLGLATAHLADAEHGCQILERWCADMQFMQQGLSRVQAGQADYRDLRSSYFARLGSRTAQPEETYAYGFYFPDFLPRLDAGGDKDTLVESAC